MKKLVLLPLLFGLASCGILSRSNHRLVVIRQLLQPGESLDWPIRDLLSPAVCVQPIGDTSLLWARDLVGDIAHDFKVGDTVAVVLWEKKSPRGF